MAREQVLIKVEMLMEWERSHVAVSMSTCRSPSGTTLPCGAYAAPLSRFPSGHQRCLQIQPKKTSVSTVGLAKHGIGIIMITFLPVVCISPSKK